MPRPRWERGPIPWTCPMPLEVLPPTPELELLLTNAADVQCPGNAGRLVSPGRLAAGRMPPADLLLPATDRHAAGMHFAIDLSPDACLLTNYSEGGTFVNGMLVRNKC